MDYKELIEELKGFTYWLGQSGPESHDIHPSVCDKAVAAIETILAERDAAVDDLTKICEDNPDVCQYCKHMPCVEPYGRCIGWEWRGPQKEV